MAFANASITLFLYNWKTNNFVRPNKSNLISGQYMKENLSDVCTVSDIIGSPCQNNTNVKIDPTTATVPFYYTYQIDPIGELFGNTQCGELNFTRYREIIRP